MASPCAIPLLILIPLLLPVIERGDLVVGVAVGIDAPDTVGQT